MEKEEKRADQENDTEEQSTEAKSLLKKKLQYYSSEIQRDVGNLVKWLMLAVLVGGITGAASTLFSFVLKSVTNCRKENEWMFYLLPVMGLIIVYLYEKFGKDDGGTNQVLSTVRSQDDVPILSAPLIFISTALTHLAGGSAGREGAATLAPGGVRMSANARKTSDSVTIPTRRCSMATGRAPIFFSRINLATSSIGVEGATVRG